VVSQDKHHETTEEKRRERKKKDEESNQLDSGILDKPTRRMISFPEHHQQASESVGAVLPSFLHSALSVIPLRNSTVRVQMVSAVVINIRVAK
jgi:hypothetical protein